MKVVLQSVSIIILFLINSIPVNMYAATDYRGFRLFYAGTTSEIEKPSASLKVNGKGQSAYDGELISVSKDSKVEFDISGCTKGDASAIDGWDFQIESPNGMERMDSVPDSYIVNTAGTWHFYLAVKGNIPSSQIQDHWDDWSENGSHEATGRWGMLWHFVEVTVNVTVDAQAIACYWGVRADGSTVQLAPNESRNETLTGSTQTSGKTLAAKTFTGWDFIESKTTYTGSPPYTGTVKGEQGKSRDVSLSLGNPTIYVFFIYDEISLKPTLGIEASPQSVAPNESYTVIDRCRPSPDAGAIVQWTVKEEFTPEGGGAKQTLQSMTINGTSNFFKPYAKAAEGIYTYSITAVKDDRGQTNSGNAGVDVYVGSQAPPVPVNKPPHAVINCSPVVTAGDDIAISGTSSYDDDGFIDSYSWNIPGATGSISGSHGTVYYMTPGFYGVGLTVADNEGAPGSSSRQIQVLSPIPTARISYTGKPSENHKISLSALASTSPARFPIDWTKTAWEISAVSGCADPDIKYAGGLTGAAVKDFLAKKAGRIRIKLTVQNTGGYAGTAVQDLDIAPDLRPVATFSLPHGTIRDQVDAEGKHFAVIPVADLSYSPDGDPIGRRIFYYTYDADNNGSFDEERKILYDTASAPGVDTVYYPDRSNIMLYDKNNAAVYFTYPSFLTGPTDTVGSWRFDEEVEEVLDSVNSIPEFLTPEDIKKDNSFWIH